MASCSGFSMPGLLNSATTSGMPFTNSTASGITCPRPLVSSTLNWLMTRKSLFAGFSKSMNCTGCGRPWSQSGKPSATVPLSSSSVADWLTSISRWPAACSRFANGARDALIVQPRLAVAQVELAQRGRQPPFEQHLAEAHAFSELGHVRIALDPLPAHHLELFAEGLFDTDRIPTRSSWNVHL